MGLTQEIEILIHIHFYATECDFLRLVIQVQEWQVGESKMTLNISQVANKIGVNINSKILTGSQIWESRSYSLLSSIS